MSSLGATWERELAASVEALGLCLAGQCLQLNDRRTRRLCDLHIPLMHSDGGCTLYVEAKATSRERWPLSTLKAWQRQDMRRLHEHGHPVGVAVLFRGVKPRPVNRAFWLSWQRIGTMAGGGWTADALAGVAVELPRTVYAGRPVWDLRAIPAVAQALEVPIPGR